jgi:hypothetical protein
MVAPTYFGITLPSSGGVPTAFWEILSWGAVDRILWMPKHVGANIRNWYTEWIIGVHVFVGFSCIFLLRILIIKGLTARRLYKSFGVKGLNQRDSLFIQFIENQGPLHVSSITCLHYVQQTLRAYNVIWLWHDCSEKATVPEPTDIISTQYTKVLLCSVSWGWASNARNM